MLRFLLLRFLPRRLIPLLGLYELYRLWMRFRSPADVRRPRQKVARDADVADVTSLTPPKVDGQVYGG